MGKGMPFVSVVIPAFNEAVMLPTCLESLKDQDYKGKYEIIVVDNNSGDLTPKIAQIYGATVIKESRQGVAFARQKGFSKAKGEYVLSTDADTVVPPDWIRRIVNEFQKDRKVVAVIGRATLIEVNTPLKLIAKTLAPINYALDTIMNYPGTLIGWNFAVKKESFIKVGGFNTTLGTQDVGEDMDLGERLKKIRKLKKVFNLKVKTSARRYKGFISSFRYVFINYFYFLIKRRSMPGTFQIVRQRSYESYDALNNLPLSFSLIILCLAAISLIIGAVPSINLWSVSSVKTQDKVIALTFDSGTSSPYVTDVINTLKQSNTKATFFVTGSLATQNPGLIRTIYMGGNTIGNHSSSLRVATMIKSPSAVLADVNATNEDIFKAIGKKPKFFRPPRGYRTVWGALSLDKYGYEIVTWNDSVNSFAKLDSRKIAITIIKNAKPGGIIELPINSNQDAKATEEIIGLLEADGYKFVTLDELLQKTCLFLER